MIRAPSDTDVPVHAMHEQPRIIVVDDEADLREMIGEYLSGHGFAIRLAADGASLGSLLAEAPADLVLLDVNMPGEDGFSIARHLRSTSDACIIMLTAAADVIDRVVGLEIGADDYITKPFDLRELLARIRSVLRRSEPSSASSALADRSAGEPDRVRFGNTTLVIGSRQLLRDDGSELKLTAMEFDLLLVFARHPNRVLSRDQLLEFAHNRGWEPFDRSIDIRITRIRRKVEVDPAKPRVIKTVRGSGYMFVPFMVGP
jgi:two-component system phosphate regulon response regulator OmpR